MSHLVFPYRNVKRDGGWLLVIQTATRKSQNVLIVIILSLSLSIQVDLY